MGETDKSSTTVQQQSQSRRMSPVTPQKRESIRIGTGGGMDPEERIADLERRLAEKDKETKDLEVKLFESSLGAANVSNFDEEPLPVQRTASKSLFPEDSLPAPTLQTPGRR